MVGNTKCKLYSCTRQIWHPKHDPLISTKIHQTFQTINIYGFPNHTQFEFQPCVWCRSTGKETSVRYSKAQFSIQRSPHAINQIWLNPQMRLSEDRLLLWWFLIVSFSFLMFPYCFFVWRYSLPHFRHTLISVGLSQFCLRFNRHKPWKSGLSCMPAWTWQKNINKITTLCLISNFGVPNFGSKGDLAYFETVLAHHTCCDEYEPTLSTYQIFSRSWYFDAKQKLHRRKTPNSVGVGNQCTRYKQR